MADKNERIINSRAQGRVVGIEHILELAESSLQYIEKSESAPILKEGFLLIHVGEWWSEFAPYGSIHVDAATLEIPPTLIEQLKPGGRLVIPVGNISQDLKVDEKNMDGMVSIRSKASFRYVALTSREDN